MAFLKGLWMVAIFASLLPSISKATPDNPMIMKEVVLNEVTAQGIIHLPPNYLSRNESHLCHYWIDFLKEFPQENWIHHSDYGVSVVAMKMHLAKGDTIELIGHPVSDDAEEVGKNKVKQTWTSDNNTELKSLEFKTKFQYVCINFKGEWNDSTARLAATLFYDNKEGLQAFCPKKMHVCACDEPNSLSRRCISQDLLCNGVRNCGASCNMDEECGSGDAGDRTNAPREPCLWTNFEYLLMMFMTGLLLILIPAVFLLTMMYHRSMNRQRCTVTPGAFDGNNNNLNRNGPHVISMPPANDIPPNYEDLPEDMKLPPSNRQQQQE